MKTRRRVWFDPVQWPRRLRAIVCVPAAFLVAWFVIIVYGTLNEMLFWAPHSIMRAVLAGSASIAFIFTGAYVAPQSKKLVASLLAVVPAVIAFAQLEISGFLRPGQLTTIGYISGAFIGLFCAFNFRPEENLPVGAIEDPDFLNAIPTSRDRDS